MIIKNGGVMNNLINEENVIRFEERFKNEGDHLYPNENIVRLVKNFFTKNEGRILDYGFGSGENLIHFLKCGYTCSGIDVAQSAKTLVKNKLTNYPHFEGKVDLHVLDNNTIALPFKDNYFDYIVSNQVLYFLADDQKIRHVLQEFIRILKPNGRLIISMMSRLNHFCIKGIEDPPHIYKYEEKDTDFIRFVYILHDEEHVRDLFSCLKIHEIGWFDNYYFGVSGHHYVILASKPS